MLDLNDIEDCLDAEAWDVPGRLSMAEGAGIAGLDFGGACDRDDRAEDGR